MKQTFDKLEQQCQHLMHLTQSQKQNGTIKFNSNETQNVQV
jgi:hypothetical protein